MILHVTKARYLGQHRIEVSFNDGCTGTADLSGALTGPVFAPLEDENEFAKLRVDEELETVAWPNGADLAPEYLYFLAFRAVPELQDRFREWGYIPAEPAPQAVATEGHEDATTPR